MPHVPKRPPNLGHLSDEAASIVLARHWGDVVRAAKELGVDRKNLRRLTWHNPRILAAAHERLELFLIGVRSKILEAVYSRSAKRRRWGFDAMFDSYEFRDHLFASAWWAAPARRSRDVEAELASPIASPPREPKALPKWEGEYGPPPLVANRYQPWEPPPLPASREPERSRSRRRLSRGGYR